MIGTRVLMTVPELEVWDDGAVSCAIADDAKAEKIKAAIKSIFLMFTPL